MSEIVKKSAVKKLTKDPHATPSVTFGATSLGEGGYFYRFIDLINRIMASLPSGVHL